MGDSQSLKVGGNLRPRDGILHQTVSKLSVAHHVFLGSWMVDICQEDLSLRSTPQRKHTAHLRQCSCCAPRKLINWDQGDDKTHQNLGVCAHEAPGGLSCSDLGRAQNAGPVECVPLWSTQEPEPEKLRPGKCTQTGACFRRFPCRATWSLSSVDRESTHAMSRRKPSVAQTIVSIPHTCQ